MGDPWGIVVVPAEGDPGGLLDDGACFSSPPMARLNRRFEPAAPRDGMVYRWMAGGREAYCAMANTQNRMRPLSDGRFGLPIWWDGKLVPEGWDRLRRVAYGLHPAWIMPTIMEPDTHQALMVARFLTKTAGARVVLLDRVEGRLVEREAPHAG